MQSKQKQFLLIYKRIPPYLKSFIIICNILIIFSSALVVFFWNKLPPQIPMFYSLPNDFQQVTAKENIIFFPGLIFIIGILNYILANTFKLVDKLILNMFSWLSIFIQSILLISMIRIIWLVT